jgi:hypothetical protein
MRSFWIRCLVVLLSLTLVSGNAYAALHVEPAHNEPCTEEHADHFSKPSEHHDPNEAADRACCCDCLGCTSAVGLPPNLTSAPVELPGVVRYTAWDDYLTGQALPPEPDPPRPITLI